MDRGNGGRPFGSPTPATSCAQTHARSSGSLSPYDGYVPQRLEQSTTAQGTPTSTVKPISQQSFPVYEPSDSRANADGLVGYPNVDLAANIVDMTIAQRSTRLTW